MPINEVFGWLWIALGFTAGAFLGPGVSQSDWLGGYASPRRRLLRLLHISLVMLGVLNILFAQTAARWELWGPTQQLAAWLLILGAVTMPLCCGLTAWRLRLQPVFAVPVLSLISGGLVLVAGMVMS